MFEGAIAAFLNRLLGRYVEDLDTEQFNVGIFSGDTCLTDLKLKPEALYQLGLPIRVEIGLIGKIILKIPWSGLFSQPIVICIEDVYAVAVPALSGPYDPEIQKRLIRAEKKKILEDLKEDEIFRAGLPPQLFDGLLASVTKNFQISINNVHIRYEEKILRNFLCACGICIQSISITTTNNKWKPGVCATNSQTVYQLIRAESFSVYMDHDTESCINMQGNWDMSTLLAWKITMHRALQTFGIKNKEFQFLLKPFTAKIKVIIHKGTEMQASRMLVDIVLQDVAMQLSEAQYATFCHIYDSLLRATVNRPHVKYRPEKSVYEESSSWWKYAYNFVLNHYIKPYTWSHIAKHRRNYRKYKDACIQSLQRPNDTELKLDMQKHEDNLTILNIVIAREHARQELRNKDIERECQITTSPSKNVNAETILPDNDQAQNITNQCNKGENQNSLSGVTENSSVSKIKLGKTLKQIDYKLNFTLANCCLSLLSKGKEMLIVTVTQFLTSIEARPTLLAFKISARAESFVVEAISTDGDLIPLITVDNVLTGNVSTYFLAIDFEKNGLNMDPIFEVSIKLEAIEVTYHHFAIVEIINFFKFNTNYLHDTIRGAYRLWDCVKRKYLNFVDDIVSQTLRISFKIDIKSPYIIFSEHGSIQKGGHIFVLDLGNVTLTNELQATNLQLEDATLMELEELLYDRLNMVFSGAQILFCHSGDDWRSARKRSDSEYHLLPKLQANVTLSYSIRPEYRQLPRTKLNVHISNVKFNLSESKLRLLAYFLNKSIVLYENNVEKYKVTLKNSISSNRKSSIIFISTKELMKVQSSVCLPSVTMMHSGFKSVIKEVVTNNVPKLDRSVVSSEVSEEDLELLSKTINLSGFDDNISPCNHINLLLRFAIGEFSVHLEDMTDSREQPYLNLRLHTLYYETAIMEYGFAVQFGIGSIFLVDKTNAGVTGSYLELISTDESYEVLVVSYRKVKSNCPDFKSHFKNIERSLVVNLLNINVNFHRSALLKMKDYWHKFQAMCHDTLLFKYAEKMYNNITKREQTDVDPPIPPGAIKLNYSTRLSSLVVRFCDKDIDLMEIKILGLENDCIYNANERMVLRAHLRSILAEDLIDDTLYSKILTTDEDKVFDLKYVRHTPRLYKCSDIDTNQDDVMSDGTFKLSIGRINCVIISKILYDLRNFIIPFTSTYYTRSLYYLKNKFVGGIELFKRSATKLHIFIDIQGPTFLLPQKKDAPSLLVFDTGVLSVENFFKNGQSVQSIKTTASDSNQLIIDNILVKLKSMTISRAIMTLTRDLEVQEPIIEPIQIQFDIKRKTEYRSIIEFQTYGLFNVQGAIDIVNINLSQRDLKSLISVWQDNISKIPLLKKIGENEDRISMQGSQKNANDDDDVMVKKLENFLTHNETALCEVNIKLMLEGLQLNLFMDTEEVLSSPVRDLNHGLCKLSFGETINTWDFYSDKSLKMKLSLQSCLLQDTRKESVVEKRIIQSPAISLEKNLESCISVSMSPIVDITYSRTQAEEKCFDVLIQDIRINLSVPFLMHLGRYFLDSLPGEQIEKGIINHGYDNNNQTNRNVLNAENDKLSRSQFAKEQPGTSISIRIQKPDIFLFGDLEKSSTHVIRMQTEVFIESSRHSRSSSIVCTLTNVNAKTKGQGNYESPCWLLRPCDIEICKKKLSCGNEEITVAINSVNIHLSAEVIHTFIDILTEASTFLNSINSKTDDGSSQNTNAHNNLWTPRKVSSIPYKKADEGDTELYRRRYDHVTFNLRPVLICLLLEMEYAVGRFPVMRMETVISTTINDWRNNFHLESNVKLHAFCYNRARQNWEPFVEFCTKDDVNYKPWEFTIKTYRGEASMINSNWTDPCHHIKQDPVKGRKKNAQYNGEDTTDMTFIGPDADMLSITRKEPETYVTYESDTDDDESDYASLTKLTKISSYLFNNNSDDEESDSDDSSTNEDEEFELILDCNPECYNPPARAPVKKNLSAPHIILYSEDKINITVTQDMIATWNAISNAFTQARGGILFVPTNTRELTVLNDIGHASRVELLVQEQLDGKNDTRVVAAYSFHDASSPVSVPSSPENEQAGDLTSPQWAGKESAVVSECKVFPTDSPVYIYKSITDELLRIIFEGFEDVLVYCPKKETCHLVSLRPVRHEVRYYLVIEASINSYLHRTICVRSPLQFRNETSYALGLYYKKAVIDKLGLTLTGETTNPFDHNVRMAIIEPDATYNIPLYIAYHCPIHILPAYLEKYQVSDEGIYWKDLRGTANAFKDVCCEAKGDNNRNVFCIRAICTELPLTTRSSGCQVPNYLINIVPPIIFNNQLPFVIDVSIPDINYEVKIEPGEKINMHSLKICILSNVQFVFKIPNYLGTSWMGAVKLNMNLERKFVLMSTDSESDLTKPFLLCLELCKILSWNIIIQSQYWVINKSGLPLFIQMPFCHSHIIYEMPEEELMVFSQKNNKKSMVQIRAHQSKWSMPFGLDGITSMSLIVCRDIERGRKYQILTEIESSRLSPIFTKIITFLPYFFICNKTKRALRFMEENEEADLWNDLLPGQEMSFWPATESMKMKIKWRNSQLVSNHFDITHTGKTVLRMDNGSALCVEIEGGVSTPYRITFRRYIAGDIPVRVDNLCDKLFLKLNQVGLGQVALLKPFQSLLYTWDDPTQTRELIWNVYSNNAVGYRAQFETDGCGHEKVSFVTIERRHSASHSSVTPKSLANMKSWSEDTSGSVNHVPSADSEATSQTFEHVHQGEAMVYWISYMEGEQRVLLFTQHESVYLKARSIIDPEASKREIFLSIAAIGISVIVQESNLHSARRELLYASVIDSVAHWELYFSKQWRNLSLELSAWLENKYTNSAKTAQLENFIVDFTKMQMTKPFFGKLRRTYSPGIWLHCRESTTLCYLQGYIHRIQIDNQLNEATFPVVLYPTLQKTFVNYAGSRRLKHCLEFSYLKQRKLRSTIYKGICVIIREFNLNLEEAFLCTLINLVPKIPETKHSIAAKLRRDVSNMRIPSVRKISNDMNSKRRDLIEQIYISPMALRLKLLANTDISNARNFNNVLSYHNVLRFIFEYAEKGTFERDVEFRLPDYRKSFIAVDSEQFLSHLSRVYVAQIMEQFHVLVRLTTVLGNQYGYNFKSPGSNFCEPDLLLMSGDESAERLAHEVACELGYATPDGLQASFLSGHNTHTLHYKMKDTSYRNPDVPPSAFLVDHSFAIEIDLETSGLITTSTNSIHREELRYFFKTLGKKTSVLFKAESSCLRIHSKVIVDIIKRAQEVGLVSRVRLPRYINPHFGVELFSTHKAKGAYLLNAISKGHCVQNDSYWGHAALHSDGKYITLVSLQRIYYIEKGSAWGSWNVKWTLETNQLLSPPIIAKNKLVLHITENEEETSSSMVDWYVESEVADILEWLCRKMNNAMILNMESSICSK